jgi:hypothetical protein
LGEGGGDRVCMSQDLERAMQDRGLIDPWTRTYAARSKPKTLPLAPPPVLVVPDSPKLLLPANSHGQLLLFDEPVVTLKTYWSGIMPASVANDVLARQKALGWSQAELAMRVGISRPQIANALAGRFGLSRQPVARLQALLAA